MTSGATILLALLSSSVLAQSTGSVRRLTIDEALALAEQHNPRLQVSASVVQGAEAAISSAKMYPNPAVTFGSLGRQRAIVDGAVPGMLHGFAVNQPIELPLVRRTRIAAAEIGVRSSQYALSETRVMVRGAVKLAFYEALHRRREVELTRDNLKLVDDLRKRIEVQVKVGEAARLELIRADAELAAAQIQVQSAQLRQAAAMSALYAAMGVSLNNVELEGSLGPPATLPALEVLRGEVLSAHPSIALADSEARRAAASLDYERAQRTPQPTLWVDVFRQPDVSQYRYGVTIDLPLWNRREGPIAEAVAASRQAAAIADQRRLEISATLERAYSLYQVANQQIQLFEAGTLQSAEAAVKAAEAAFRFGERSVIEVLDAQRVLRSARLDYLNAQFDRQQALIELEQLRALDVKGDRP